MSGAAAATPPASLKWCKKRLDRILDGLRTQFAQQDIDSVQKNLYHQERSNSTKTILDDCYCLTEIIGDSLDGPDLVGVKVQPIPSLPSVTFEKKFDVPIAIKYGETQPTLNTIQFTIGQNTDLKGISQGKNNALISLQFNEDYKLPQNQDGISTKAQFYGNYLSGNTPLYHGDYFFNGESRQQRRYLDIRTTRDPRTKFTHCSIPNCICLPPPSQE